MKETTAYLQGYTDWEVKGEYLNPFPEDSDNAKQYDLGYTAAIKADETLLNDLFDGTSWKHLEKESEHAQD